MGSVALHGASLYFGMVSAPQRLFAKAMGAAPSASNQDRERMLALADGDELSQPSYAAPAIAPILPTALAPCAPAPWQMQETQ